MGTSGVTTLPMKLALLENLLWKEGVKCELINEGSWEVYVATVTWGSDAVIVQVIAWLNGSGSCPSGT